MLNRRRTCELLFRSTVVKHPSPVTKPEIHSGWRASAPEKIIGRSTGTVLGK